MPVKIRLLRVGKKKQPYYRVVVADSRSPRDGRIIERLGRYSPLDEPSLIEFDEERALHWLRHGAQPTEAIQKILETSGVWDQFKVERPKADTAARKAISHHKAALAARPAEPEPEPEPAAEPAADEPAAEAPAAEEPAADEPAAEAPAAEEPAAEESAAEEEAEKPAAEESVGGGAEASSGDGDDEAEATDGEEQASE